MGSHRDGSGFFENEKINSADYGKRHDIVFERRKGTFVFWICSGDPTTVHETKLYEYDDTRVRVRVDLPSDSIVTLTWGNPKRDERDDEDDDDEDDDDDSC